MPWVAVFCVSNTPVQTFGSKSEGQPCINFLPISRPFPPPTPIKKIHSDSLANTRNPKCQKAENEKFILKPQQKKQSPKKKVTHQWVIMDTIGIYEYNSKDLIGHGAFAVVYKGRVKMVSLKESIFTFGYRNNDRVSLSRK